MKKKQVEVEGTPEATKITVKELPKQEVRKFLGDDKIEYEMVTIEERIDEISLKLDKILALLEGS